MQKTTNVLKSDDANELTKTTTIKPTIKKFLSIGVLLAFIFCIGFVFKKNLAFLLEYLDSKSRTNILEFHLIFLTLFLSVSLPFLWAYIICVLALSYLYTFLYGFVFVVFYSAIGMTFSFYVCRHVLYKCARQRIDKISYLLAISKLIEENEKGFRIIFLSRLTPIPFGLSNTLFALSGVNYRKFIIASFTGLIPTQLILCYTGSKLKSMSDVMVNDRSAKTASFIFLVEIVIAISLMSYIINSARIELNRHLNIQKDDLI